MKKIYLSIIIVSWNTKDLLVQCIESIIKTTFKVNFEIIVVDNNSSDNSVEYVKNNFPDVQLICLDNNYGFAKANNIGIKASKGNYISLINSDIIVLDNCIDNLINHLEINSDIGLIGPKILNANYSFQATCRRFPNLINTLSQSFGLNYFFHNTDFYLREKDLTETKEVEALTGCFWIVRKEAFEQIGTLDEHFFFYGEDVDWCKHLSETTWKTVYFPYSKAIHLGGASSSLQPLKYYIELQKAKLKFWTKYNGKISTYIFIFFMSIHEILRLFYWIFIMLINPFKAKSKFYIIKRYFTSSNFYLSNLRF
jgi:GT2 family glycosyltransferase